MTELVHEKLGIYIQNLPSRLAFIKTDYAEGTAVKSATSP